MSSIEDMDREALYLALPVPLQKLVVQLEGARIQRRRYGGKYGTVEREVLQRCRFDAKTLAEYRKTRLFQHFAAAARTPYWLRRFMEFNVDPTAPDPFKELEKLPILTKADVKAHALEFVNPDVAKRDLIARHTSGTTGSGLIFYETPECERETWATWWRYRSWHGISRETRCGYFGGRSVVPLSQTKPPYWRMNRPGRQLMLSGYHLSVDTAETYVDALVRYGVTWLHGYPSIIALLAQYLTDMGHTLPTVTKVTTGAESLLNLQRRQIRRAFPNAKLAQHYGQAEAVANISQCPAGSLHVDEDFAHVEFIPIAGVPTEYRIVGTNWTNAAFPLFRYDTGDVAKVVELACACGRPWRMVDELDGRIEDYVILPSGARVGRTDHIFKDMVNVVEAQIRQDVATAIEIAVVRGPRYTWDDERALLAEARRRLGDEIEIKIRYEAHLPRTRTGKVRLVVSSISRAAIVGRQ